MVPALLHSLSDCQVPARLGRNEEGGEDRKSNPRDGGDRQSAGAAATKSHPALYLERMHPSRTFFSSMEILIGKRSMFAVLTCTEFHVKWECLANISYVDARFHFLIDFCTMFNFV